MLFNHLCHTLTSQTNQRSTTNLFICLVTAKIQTLLLQQYNTMAAKLQVFFEKMFGGSFRVHLSRPFSVFPFERPVFIVFFV